MSVSHRTLYVTYIIDFSLNYKMHNSDQSQKTHKYVVLYSVKSAICFSISFVDRDISSLLLHVAEHAEKGLHGKILAPHNTTRL